MDTVKHQSTFIVACSHLSQLPEPSGCGNTTRIQSTPGVALPLARKALPVNPKARRLCALCRFVGLRSYRDGELHYKEHAEPDVPKNRGRTISEPRLLPHARINPKQWSGARVRGRPILISRSLSIHIFPSSLYGAGDKHRGSNRINRYLNAL